MAATNNGFIQAKSEPVSDAAQFMADMKDLFMNERRNAITRARAFDEFCAKHYGARRLFEFEREDRVR